MKVRIGAIINSQAGAALPFTAAEDWLVEQAAPLIQDFNPKLTGLYLATMDAGVSASIQFWADGLHDGLALANPRDFPRTLANSPAARITIHYCLQGPAYTLVGGDEATLAALEHARDDLLVSRIESALVIRFDMAPVTSVIGLTLTTMPLP